ncbi:MAG: UDP-3-O-acyl-N-acetylglucosamine deacetylase [Holosporaceae bacterium]|jgi:UDP-3-O-[3-hydroxymyristoyl] N-acetylglucosamine deacetylase|nr:UDP-3-O-acyl-N-acetylglucosamine deacetylase [Holosporaceae bacterium]
MFQSTLKSEVFLEGVGVHSGMPCSIFVHPAPMDAGITFRRDEYNVEARFDNVIETTLCTTLSLGPNRVSTVEHLLAALHGLGVTNAIIETKDDEIPILDGSALPFVENFLSFGIEKQTRSAKILRVLDIVKVQEAEKWVSLSPADSFASGLSISIECDFSAKGLYTEPAFFNFATGDFAREIAPARSFGFLADVEYLKKNNLARGASLESSLVFDNKGISINESGLRLPNEAVRHKLLDIIGDLSLAQCHIIGQFDGFCPNHCMNNMLLRKLFEKSSNFKIT